VRPAPTGGIDWSVPALPPHHLSTPASEADFPDFMRQMVEGGGWVPGGGRDSDRRRVVRGPPKRAPIHFSELFAACIAARLSFIIFTATSINVSKSSDALVD
jgi:hypothetical protein